MKSGDARRPSRVRPLVLGVLVLASFGLALGRLGDRLILWPSTTPEDFHGANELKVPVGAGQLQVFRASSSSKEPEAFVLRFYGNADRAERWISGEAAAWPDHAIEFWGVNYPGYGASTGPARLQGVADGAIAAYDALRKVAGSRPIYIFGTSLGTTAALHVAAERDVAGLMLQNPPALRQLIVGDHGWWNLWLLAYPVSLQVPSALDSVANASRVRCPCVFLLADQDEVVRHKYHRLVADAFGGPKDILIQEGAHHNTPMSPEFGRRVHAAAERLLAAHPSP
jgi:pimeloyl-ACP methyl ester carboxylesterase